MSDIDYKLGYEYAKKIIKVQQADFELVSGIAIVLFIIVVILSIILFCKPC